MNVAIRDVLTVDQYLAWARTQGEKPRTELINGHIVAMSPERAAHNRAKIAVLFALRQALSGARRGVHRRHDRANRRPHGL
jgi:Uma2 family endonuclease